MKKLLILFLFVTLAFQGYSQLRYDDGGIYVNGSKTEFVTHGTSWDHRFITYFFQNNTNDINQILARQAIRNAFATWQAQTRLYFIEVCNAATADIVISWVTGNHGDGAPFDGQNGVLAHAFFPPPNSGSLAGDIHFDDDESWTDIFQSFPFQPIDLQTVALHEIGHSLGLEHESAVNAIMNPFYNGSRRNLEVDDINGVRSLYGAPVSFITGPDNFRCSASYGIAETLPPGYSLTWSTSSPQVSVTPGGNVTATGGFTGLVTLTATVSSGCGTLAFTKQINVLASQIPDCHTRSAYWYVNGYQTTLGKCAYLTQIRSVNQRSTPATGKLSLFDYYANAWVVDPTASSITWSYVSSSGYTSWSATGNQLLVTINTNSPNGWIRLRCTTSNGCGSYSWDFWFTPQGSTASCPVYFDPNCLVVVDKTNAVQDPSPALEISPNPTTGQFTIVLNSTNKDAVIKEVVISNKMGLPVYQQRFNGGQKTQNINLSGKPTDIYTVRVFDGTIWMTKKMSLLN